MSRRTSNTNGPDNGCARDEWDRDDDMAAFDALPKSLRDVANYAPVKCTVLPWRDLHARWGAHASVKFLREQLMGYFGVYKGPERRA